MVCPEDDALVSFARSDLATYEAEAIASHLDECEACRHAVRAGAQAAPMAVGTPSLPLERSQGVAIGASIGRYEVRRLLGAGGMGRVYAAYDAELEREVALKVLRPELGGHADMLAQRLLRESRLTAKITHPAVMTVYDVGRADDVVFIAMELIHGETLGAFVARIRPGWRTCVEMYERAAHGLAAAHAAGIVHRDFKPENVLVELAGDRRIVVSDFGIARAAGQADAPSTSSPREGHLTATGVAIGTPAYMAPEQLAGEQVDHRADIFAFAVSLWEAIFSARPFIGTAFDPRRAAKPGRTVPRRLLRALERGLELEAASRWPDLSSFTRELATIRARRRRIQVAGLATALVGAGIAGALVLSRAAPEHPCARGFELPWDRAAVVHALAADPAISAKVLASLDANVVRFRVTQAETCIADRVPAQALMVTTCLDARRTELAGVTADLIADGPGHARTLVGLISHPERCAAPPPALQFSRVPEDPVLRRKVTALRYRAFDAEATRDAGDFKTAIAQARQIAQDAAKVWPPVAAETLYLLGATEGQGGDPKLAAATLKQAAALAEASHHDFIAAATWIQLVLSATFDDGEPARGLEYVTYAEAALDRLGRPAEVDALFQYAKGTTLIEAHQPAQAETALRRAVEISERAAPDYLPQAIQGLGYLYESQGRYTAAVAAYRDALAHLPATGNGVVSAQIMFKGRLAVNLKTLGLTAEAVVVAREAKQLADASLGEDSLDRVIAHTSYAQCLEDDHQPAAALAESHAAVETLRRIAGDRTERYAEALMIEGWILVETEHYLAAEPKLARACDVIAFATGEASEQQAECWQYEAQALAGLARGPEALVLIDKTAKVFQQTYGDVHPKVAETIGVRGQIQAGMHHHGAAVADLEASIAMFTKLGDAGHTASVQYALARELWQAERARGKAVMATAIATLSTTEGNWTEELATAREWLVTEGHPVVHKGL